MCRKAAIRSCGSVSIDPLYLLSCENLIFKVAPVLIVLRLDAIWNKLTVSSERRVFHPRINL